MAVRDFSRDISAVTYRPRSTIALIVPPIVFEVKERVKI
jgi:hypothetical protein